MKSSLKFQTYFKQEVSQTKKLLKTVRGEHTADDIHDLRVGLRRINTIIQVLKNDRQAGISKNAQKFRKKIWRNLSDVRDMDVSVLLAKKFSIPTGPILKWRDEAETKLMKNLKKKEAKTFLGELDKLAKNKVLNQVHALPTIRRLQDAIKKTPARPDNIHAFRITLKKVRYLFEAMGHDVNGFKKYQDALGELMDLQVFLRDHHSSVKAKKEYKLRLKKALAIVSPARTMALRQLDSVELL
jgi:CHAD domain-containing protein